MTLKLEDLKSIYFWKKGFVCGSNKIWHNFQSFWMDGIKRNEAKRHFVHKKALFLNFLLGIIEFKSDFESSNFQIHSY